MIIVLVWTSIKPSNDRNWSLDQAVLSRSEITDTEVTIHNIRNFTYRSTTDFTVNYYDKKFKLDDISSIYYCVEPFPGLPGAAHTFLSFGFANGDHIALSVEVRKQKGEKFSPLRAMIRGYELMYVIADENDVLKLRTNHRDDPVYVYPLKMSKEKIRNTFVDSLKRANKLSVKPEFYNLFINNCTTNIIRHLNATLTQRIRYNYEILMPRFSDKLFYRKGLIDTKLPFLKMKKFFHVNERAKKHANALDFPVKIRVAESPVEIN